MHKILLSIAIPTFNRADWLRLCLTNLVPQIEKNAGEVEVTVYDNASPDHTQTVVKSFLSNNVPLSYFKSDENIGSDKNIAKCFNNAIGEYVLILGDDDVVLDDGIEKILHAIKKSKLTYGAIYMRAYGYDLNFENEKPVKIFRSYKEYRSVDEFIINCSSGIAFISSLIINKSNILHIDANQFVGTALVQTYLFYEAARSANTNLFVDEYLIAAKRIEQRDYNVTQVFGEALNDALDYFVARGFSERAATKINKRLLWYFFPFFLMQLHKKEKSQQRIDITYKQLKSRYSKELFFWIFCAPILKLPTKLAIVWGSCMTITSRLLNGEFGRLWVAFIQKLKFL